MSGCMASDHLTYTNYRSVNLGIRVVLDQKYFDELPYLTLILLFICRVVFRDMLLSLHI